MTNSRDSPKRSGAASSKPNRPSQPEKQGAEQIDQRQYAPIQSALRDEAVGYDWRRETDDIESYQHRDHHGWLHIDPAGSFYDRQAQPISREVALENAGHVPSPTLNVDLNTRSTSTSNDQGFSL